MPIYEYQCTECGEALEEMVLPGRAEPTVCPKCGKPNLSRVISTTSFQLKGGGWYVSDYKGTKSTPSDGGSGGAASDTKSATGSE